MQETISPSEIYDKDLNFLFGSGASYGLFPTLALNIKNIGDQPWTLEELATHFENENDKRYVPLFMHYYKVCIRPAQVFSTRSVVGNQVQENVVGNYQTFLNNVLKILQRRKSLERRCNLFTTNYDGCFPLVADEILRKGTVDFVLNDGARGFRHRYLQAKNFNSYLCETGVFERHRTSVPQINLVHAHGSVYWRKEDSNIVVDYSAKAGDDLLSAETRIKLEPFSSCLENAEATLPNLTLPDFTDAELNEFWTAYKTLPIVNPTKWKFHETVFEEHYYQMLRLLSYELEKPNAVLVTFGFSFADEHILNLLKRSLSNPHLQVFVCCFNKETQNNLREEFRGFKNVTCLAIEDGCMDFTVFNEQIFLLESKQTDALPVAAAAVVEGAV